MSTVEGLSVFVDREIGKHIAQEIKVELENKNI